MSVRAKILLGDALVFLAAAVGLTLCMVVLP